MNKLKLQWLINKKDHENNLMHCSHVGLASFQVGEPRLTGFLILILKYLVIQATMVKSESKCVVFLHWPLQGQSCSIFYVITRHPCPVLVPFHLCPIFCANHLSISIHLSLYSLLPLGLREVSLPSFSHCFLSAHIDMLGNLPLRHISLSPTHTVKAYQLIICWHRDEPTRTGTLPPYKGI